MYTAILLDGTRNPICISLKADEAGEYKAKQKRSIAWSGSATNIARDFNFSHVIPNNDQSREVLIFVRVGVKPDSLVPGLRMSDLDVDTQRDEFVTVKKQGEVLAEQFLYPEKYAHMGQVAA